MRLLLICAIVPPLGWTTCTPLLAQAASARVQTVAGVHTAAFETPQGTIRVHVSSDASPGDSISGRILVEEAGATPQDRRANLIGLNNSTLEWQGQRTPVSAGRYEWLIPIELRAGTGALVLRDREGLLVSQALVPVDPVPAPPRPPSPADAFEPPAVGEIGHTVVIRGRFDGRLRDGSVTVGGAEAEILASSPRQFAFRVPATPPGDVPFRFTSNQPVVEGRLRVVDFRLSASRTQLLRGQRATLTVTIFGLGGITQPMRLTVVNGSPVAVRVEDIDRPITITPGQIRRGGTFEITRRIVGMQPGPFQIAASVSRPPLEQFDVQRSTIRTLTDWQAKTGVAITAGASKLMERSVVNTRLDEFLTIQGAYRADVQEVFAALLSHYCFDLRDDGLSRRRAMGGPGASAGIMLVALRQDRGGATITEQEVRRLSFSDFVSRLTERFTTRQPAGYLFVRSVTPRAPITIDGQRNDEVTNRRFVTPAGDHQVVVTGSKACRQRVTVIAFQTRVVDCGV